MRVVSAVIQTLNPQPSNLNRYLGAWAFVLLTFGVIKFVALCAIVGLAMVYSKFTSLGFKV